MSSEVAQDLLKRCKAADAGHTGFITVDALKAALTALGEDLGDADVEEMVDEAECWKDTKDKREVSYAKLIDAMYRDEDQ